VKSRRVWGSHVLEPIDWDDEEAPTRRTLTPLEVTLERERFREGVTSERDTVRRKVAPGVTDLSPHTPRRQAAKRGAAVRPLPPPPPTFLRPLPPPPTSPRPPPPPEPPPPPPEPPPEFDVDVEPVTDRPSDPPASEPRPRSGHWPDSERALPLVVRRAPEPIDEAPPPPAQGLDRRAESAALSRCLVLEREVEELHARMRVCLILAALALAFAAALGTALVMRVL
jgi:hypothetical protein